MNLLEFFVFYFKLNGINVLFYQNKMYFYRNLVFRFFFLDELLYKYKFQVKVLGLGENYLRMKYFLFRNNSIFFIYKIGNKK